jgi:hypothetical protein
MVYAYAADCIHLILDYMRSSALTWIKVGKFVWNHRGIGEELFEKAPSIIVTQ